MSAKLVKRQLNTLLTGGLLASSDTQQGSASTSQKPASKVHKQAKKERLRQKRKRVAAAAAAGSVADTAAVRERNLRYYVETAKADAEVQKLMHEARNTKVHYMQMLGLPQPPTLATEETDEDLMALFG